MAYLENKVFLENAADFVEAGYKTSMRMGVETTDYTQIQVYAKPFSMVRDVTRIVKGQVTLEMKSGDGPWTAVDREPIMRGGLYKWTQLNIILCTDHAIRLCVKGKEEGKSAFFFQNGYQRQSQSTLINSEYKLQRH